MRLHCVNKTVPNSYAVKCYREFKTVNKPYGDWIIYKCFEMLRLFLCREITDLTSTDDIEIDRIGDEMTAVFVIVPEDETARHKLAAIFFAQFFARMFNYCENTAEYTQIVADAGGNVIRSFRANIENRPGAVRKAEAFLKEAGEGSVRFNESAGRYEVNSSSGETVCFRGTKEDAEKELMSIKDGRIIDNAERPNRGMSLPVQTMVIFTVFSQKSRIRELCNKFLSRRFGVSMMFIVESLEQMRAVYPDDEDDVAGRCTWTVLSGGHRDGEAVKLMSRMAGKAEYSRDFTSKNILPLFGVKTASKEHIFKTLQSLPEGKCIIIGARMVIFIDETYNAQSHPEWKLVTECRASDDTGIGRLHDTEVPKPNSGRKESE